jgi:hypothetical protein
MRRRGRSDSISRRGSRKKARPKPPVSTLPAEMQLHGRIDSPARSRSTSASAAVIAAPTCASSAFRLRSMLKETAVTNPSRSAGGSESRIFSFPGPHAVWPSEATMPMSNPRRVAPSGRRWRSSAASAEEARYGST